ncbi:hypothetical protein [Acinetobacter sp.]|uniref:hypothetical protein n=1 Tax=Acinetobacter sp. TaxID=472 RepID=UPI003CFE2FA1
MLIVGINGKIKSGKDTFAQKVSDVLKTKYGYNVHIIHFADALKEAVMDLFELPFTRVFTQEGKARPLPQFNNITTRFILQKFGTEVARNIYHNIWVWKLFRTINKPKYIDTDVVLIPDMRFINEFKSISFLINGVNVRLLRPGFKHPNGEHESEWGLDRYPYLGNKFNPINYVKWLWNFGKRKFKPLDLRWDAIYSSQNLDELDRNAELFALNLANMLNQREKRVA